MNRSKIIITSEKLFGDPNRPKFGAIREEFNPTEIGFLVENINRRSDLNLDRDSLNLVSVPALIQILHEIEDEFLDPGKIFSLIIRTKLKNP